uniref:Tetraspanin n=1 Tax=Ditylenchus dipsaci TaxID=166011 RepID=A0A915EGJ1_9BILA
MRNGYGNSCSRACFLFFTFFFWLNGIALLCFGLWVLLDPARYYTLDLVDFSEDEPLLKFATYGLLAVAGSERCLVGSFIFFLMLILLIKASLAFMAQSYKDKFPDNRMQVYLANISQTRYYRDKWVQPEMDTIQFYQQCCGGYGPKDYLNSFWYITNTERGTRSFVPQSCCRQSQQVNTKGCGTLMKQWTNNQTYIFIIVTAATALTDLIGISIGLIYMRQISEYSFVTN